MSSDRATAQGRRAQRAAACQEHVDVDADAQLPSPQLVVGVLLCPGQAGLPIPPPHPVPPGTESCVIHMAPIQHPPAEGHPGRVCGLADEGRREVGQFCFSQTWATAQGQGPRPRPQAPAACHGQSSTVYLSHTCTV